MEAACASETLYTPVHGVKTHMKIRRECTELCGLFVKVKVKIKVKVKVKVKVKFSLEQATKAQRESRGIAVLFL